MLNSFLKQEIESLYTCLDQKNLEHILEQDNTEFKDEVIPVKFRINKIVLIESNLKNKKN